MESSSKLFILFSIFFLLLSTLSQPAAAADSINIGEDPVSRYRTLLALQRKNNRNQIPNCGEMMSRSQCSQNPKCRWCRSEALDDMCFSKTEARRLPQQVFLCDWFNSLFFFCFIVFFIDTVQVEIIVILFRFFYELTSLAVVYDLIYDVGFLFLFQRVFLFFPLVVDLLIIHESCRLFFLLD